MFWVIYMPELPIIWQIIGDRKAVFEPKFVSTASKIFSL